MSEEEDPRSARIGHVRRVLRSATKRSEQMQRDKAWEKPKNYASVENKRWSAESDRRSERRKIPITLATTPWKDDGKD